MENLSPFVKPNLLAFSTYENPDNRDEFEEQNDSSQQEECNTQEGKRERNIALCITHGCIHDPREDREAVEQRSYHEYTYDDEYGPADDHPDTGEGCLTDCLGVVNQLHTLGVCALEVSRNFLKHVKCTSLIN